MKTSASRALLLLLTVVVACNGNDKAPMLKKAVDYRVRLAEFSKSNYRVLERHASGQPRRIRLLRTDPVPRTRFKAGSIATFDQKGVLRSLTIRYAASFQGVVCSSSRGAIEFHGNGKLKSCTLDEAWRMGGLVGLEYSRIEFHGNGRLREIVNVAPAKDGKWPDGKLRFNEQGLPE